MKRPPSRPRFSQTEAFQARVQASIVARCKSPRKYDVFAAAESSAYNRKAPITLPKLRFLGQK